MDLQTKASRIASIFNVPFEPLGNDATESQLQKQLDDIRREARPIIRTDLKRHQLKRQYDQLRELNPRFGRQLIWQNSTKADYLTAINKHLIKFKSNITPQNLKQALDQAKKRHYKVSISFKWQIEDKEILPHQIVTNYEFTTKKISQADIERKAFEVADDYAQERSNPLYVVRILDLEVNSFEVISNVDSLKDKKLFRTNLSYPQFGLQAGLPTGLCGYEILLKNYPTKAISIEHLEQTYNWDRKNGLSVSDISRFCYDHRIPMYVVDLMAKEISIPDSKPETYDHHLNALVVTVANDHIYEVDKKYRKKIIQSVIAQKTFMLDLTKKSFDLKEPPANVIEREYIRKDSIHELFYEFLKDGLVYNSKWNHDHCTAIYTPKVHYFASPDYDIVSKVCKDLEIEFTNQSLSQIARSTFEAFDMNRTFKESSYPKFLCPLETMDPDNKYMYYNPFHASAITMNFEDFTETANLKLGATDQYKQYSSVALEGDLMYITILSTVSQFQHDDPIQCGFYMVNTGRGSFPYFSNNPELNSPDFKAIEIWLDYKAVGMALEMQVIGRADIKYHLSAINDRDMNDTIKNYIHHIYKSTDQAKHIVNRLIGSFNSRKIKKPIEPLITQSYDEASYYFYKLKSCPSYDVAIKTMDLPNGQQAFRIQATDTIPKLTDSRPIFKSIVDRANMKTYAMMVAHERQGLKVIGIKTDCVLYKYNIKKQKQFTHSQLVKNPTFGQWRKEQISEKTITKTEQKRPQKKNSHGIFMLPSALNYPRIADTNEYFDARTLLRYDRVFVEGCAGTGKSFVIRELVSLLLENGLRVATTSYVNTSANNINGCTLHKLFHMDITGDLKPERYQEIVNEYDVLIVDEINQAPELIYRLLSTLPESIKLYVFGDHRQEKPVETNKSNPVDYLDTQMFASLVNYNKIILTKQCRASAGWSDDCAGLFDAIQASPDDEHLITKAFLQKYNIRTYWQQNKSLYPQLLDNKINIVKTNALRMFINDTWMNHYAGHSSGVGIDTKEGKMHLYQGLPIILTQSRKNLNLTKNTILHVDSVHSEKQEVEAIELDNHFKPSGSIKTISFKELSQHFLPCYAMTTFKAEGKTIPFKHTIYEFNRMDHHKKYTAITRTTGPELLTVVNMPCLFQEEHKEQGLEFTIYQIKHNDKPVYIGCTRNSIKQRFREHCFYSKNGFTKLYKFMRSHPLTEFTIEALHTGNGSHDAMLKCETYYIELHDMVQNGLNSKFK